MRRMKRKKANHKFSPPTTSYSNIQTHIIIIIIYFIS